MRRILAASAVAVLSVTLAGPALADHKPKHTKPERPVAAPPQDRPPAVTPPSGVVTPRTPVPVPEPVQEPPLTITSAYAVDSNGSGAFDATYDAHTGTNDGLPDYLRVTFSEPVQEPGGFFTAQLAVVDANGRSLSRVGNWYFYPYSPLALAPNEAVILPMHDDGSLGYNAPGYTYYPPGAEGWDHEPLFASPTITFSTGPVYPLTVTGVSGVTDLDGNPVDLAGSDIVIGAQAPTP